MSLLVTGSIGIDTVKTPFGMSENCVGGSAVYFSLAASYFSAVRFMGVIGDDCPFDLSEVFAGKDVDLRGLEVREGSKTFRWSGSYEGAMNDAKTDDVELNVLSEAPPKIPEVYEDSNFVFLANTAPSLQMEMLLQVDGPRFAAADTMNMWIETAREDLNALLDRVNMLVLNEGEAKLLTGHRNVLTAGKAILDLGPEYVIIKRGEYGSALFGADGDMFMLPAYPTEVVIDPTGAGDSFAGAMMGFLAQSEKVDSIALRKAIVYGTVAASFTIGDFSIHGISSVSREEIENRFDVLRKVTQF